MFFSGEGDNEQASADTVVSWNLYFPSDPQKRGQTCHKWYFPGQIEGFLSACELQETVEISRVVDVPAAARSVNDQSYPVSARESICSVADPP